MNNIKNDEIVILNKKQLALYVANGLQPIRIEVDSDNKEFGKLLFIFNKEATKPLWEKYLKHELKF